MLRKILLYTYISLTSLIAYSHSITVYSQSIDEKLVNAINSTDWFALDSIHSSVPKDSIHPYIEVYSRCLIGYKLNRPDISIPAFNELFDTQSEYLDLNGMLSSAFMFGRDLSKVGENEFAASMINQVLDETQEYLDSAIVANFAMQVNWYKGLAAYKPYQIQFNGDGDGTVPFTIVPMGPKEKGGVLMQLGESKINGMPADIIFDTGCASSIISPEKAEKYGLIPLEGTNVSVTGVSETQGYLAIAKELQIGNITLRDIPFTVAPLSSVNDDADQYSGVINILLGNDLMLHLKEVTMDFIANKLIIPSKAPFIPVKTDAKPNMCFSESSLLLCKCNILKNPLLMLIDSGDNSYGVVGEAFFENNKQYVVDNGIKDTVKQAGIGGIKINERYILPNVEISLGGHTVDIPEIDVRTTQEVGSGSECEGVIGLRTLMLYSSVRFNFVDFVLTTGEPRKD